MDSGEFASLLLLLGGRKCKHLRARTELIGPPTTYGKDAEPSGEFVVRDGRFHSCIENLQPWNHQGGNHLPCCQRPCPVSASDSCRKTRKKYRSPARRESVDYEAGFIFREPRPRFSQARDTRQSGRRLFPNDF